MTPAEFSSAIRKKYPGSYDSVDDNTLASKFVEKFPAYKGQVQFDVVSPQPEVNNQGLAEKASSLVVPPASAELPNTLGGWIGRMGRAAKETVMSPISPWFSLGKDKEKQDLAKRMMSPAAGQVGFSQVGQEIGDAGRQSILNSAENAGTKIAESPIANVSPGLAAGLGATTAAAGKMAALTPMLTPVDLQARFGAKGLNDVLGMGFEAAQNELKKLQKISAGSAFGGMKAVFNKIRGGSDRFGDSAMAMQEKGALGAFTGPEEMLKRVETIQDAAGSEMGKIHSMIDASGEMPLDSKAISEKIRSSLSSELNSGYGKRLNREVEKVVSTIKGFGKTDEINNIIDEIFGSYGEKINSPGQAITEIPGGPITFKQLMEIKDKVNPGKWGDFQKLGMGEDAKKIFEIRQRATAILGKALDDGVETATKGTPEILNRYLEAKKTYGMAADVAKGIGDKVERLNANQYLNWTAGGIASVGLYKMINGDPEGAAKYFATAAGIKYLKSLGPQQGAMIYRAIGDAMQSLGKSTTPMAQQMAQQGTTMGLREILNKAKKK